MLQRSRQPRPTSPAKTSNLQLPCDKNTLKALFPSDPFHLHFCTFCAEWTPAANKDVSMLKFALDVALHCNASSWSIECGGEAAVDLLEQMKRKHSSMDFVELDCADLGVASHRNRVVAGSEALIAALRRTSRYEKRYCSIADAFAQAKQEMRGSFVRLGPLLLPLLPMQSAGTASRRKSVQYPDDPTLPLVGGKSTRHRRRVSASVTIEEAAIVAGFASFKLGEKRAVARRLIGAATPPALLRVLLHNYEPRCASRRTTTRARSRHRRQRPRAEQNQSLIVKFLNPSPVAVR